MISTERLNLWADRWAALMGGGLIDATLSLVVVALVWAGLRRWRSPQLGYWLFLLVLIKLIVPVPVTVPAWSACISPRHAVDHLTGWEANQGLSPVRPVGPASPANRPLTALSAEVAALGMDDAAASMSSRVSTEALPQISLRAKLMLGWAGVVLVLLAGFTWVQWRLARVLRKARILDPRTLTVDLDHLRALARVRRPVRLLSSALVGSPAVGGLFRPRLLLPADLVKRLTRAQMRWVLLHELAHIRRGDVWIATLQRLVQIAYFFHPAVWLANWAVNRQREYACDDAALAVCDASRRDCGAAFLTIVERASAAGPRLGAALGMFHSKTFFRRRLMRILNPHRRVRTRLSAGSAATLLAVALIVLPNVRAGEESAAPVASASAGGPARSVADRTGDLSTHATRAQKPLKHVLRDPRELEGDRRVKIVGWLDAETLWSFSHAADDEFGRRTHQPPYEVTFWDGVSGRVKGVLKPPTDSVELVAFSPDAKTAASNGLAVDRETFDFAIQLLVWDVETATETTVLDEFRVAAGEPAPGIAMAVAFSPDGKTLASGHGTGEIYLWDLTQAAPVQLALEGHDHSIWQLSFSADGQTLASASHDKTVKIWSTRRLQLRHTLAGHPDGVRAAALSRDGKLVATGGYGQSAVILWNAETGERLGTLQGHSDQVASADISPDGKLVAAGAFDSTVRVWDVETRKLVATFDGHQEDLVHRVAFSPDGKTLASAGGWDKTVRLWQVGDLIE